MRTINVQQGSREWLGLRAQHHTASEAPAMMGASRYQSRTQLLQQKATGIMQEVDGHTQALFDRGHATEAAARVLLEQDLGEELYPVTGLDDAGRLLASFDGITMDGSTGFEHKLWSERLAGQVRAGDLEPHYYWQLEQQILVGGLEKVIFVTSDGTPESWAQMTYYPVPGRAEQLLAGWAQFDADLAAYVPPEVKSAPVVGRAPEHLPALRIEVTGQVTASNLAEFRATAMAAIKGVNRELSTDADFADAEASVKWCAEVESRLAAAKQHALSQTMDVDALFRTMDDIAAEARRVRLELDKLVKQRKEQLRGEIVAGGVAALREHIACLNAAMPASYMPQVPADFGGAVKGKRTVESLRGAVNDELARAKIAANEVSTRIQHNLKTLHDTPGIHLALFPDVATIVLKACDDFAALVQARMAGHQAAELARQQDEAQAQLRREDQARMLAEANAAAEALFDRSYAPELLIGLPAAQEHDAGERINLGAINAHLAPIKLDAAGLEQLGFSPVATVKAAKQYRACDLKAIRAALAQHLARLAQLEIA